MDLFTFSDYKTYLRARLEAVGQRSGVKSQLAAAAGCQPSYLSRVLGDEGDHLTPDHALGISQFWAFSETETEFFLELLHHARAGTPSLRKWSEKRLARMRVLRADLSERYQKKSALNESEQTRYYSSWMYAAVHVALTVPRLQSVDALSRYFHMDRPAIHEVLESLERMGLARRDSARWRSVQKNIHLERNSPLMFSHLMNWRMQSLQRFANADQPDFRYTAVHSLSDEDFGRIREILLQSIDRVREVVNPSPEEQVGCLNIDWFRY